MNKRFSLYRMLLLAFVLILAPLSARSENNVPPKGFTAIFNGKDLSGWHGWAVHSKGGNPFEMAKATAEAQTKMIEGWTADAKKHWSVQDGDLVNDGFGAYLSTDKAFGDVEFLIDYKTVAKADSGIYMRATPQVQIWDSSEADPSGLGKKFGSGGLWNNSKGAAGKDPLSPADKPLGEWNQFRIIQVGERTTVYLNGKLVVDHARLENFWDRKSPLQKAAPVLLQTHGGEIRWRNIFAREIPTEEANAMLAAKSGTGFTSVFNGKDFDGWAGPVDNYEVVDGAIVCKPKKGGTLFTKEEYSDFVAQVEFKLPKGGNNGLAIRYPGKGDPAYAGMCELQVLDDDAEQYKTLDKRQYHGSAYGMAASARGYQRPVGEWNFQQVTVKGSTIKVELNGSLILDTDLSKITDYMAKSPHPGKELTTGHFGFAGHNDPVAFRNVKIKKIVE